MESDLEHAAPMVSGPYLADGWTLDPAYLDAIESSTLIRHHALPVPTVVGYDNVARVLRSKVVAAAGQATLQAQGITSGPIHERAGRSVLNLDGPKHQSLRAILTDGLSAQLVADQVADTRTRLVKLIELS